MKLKTSAKILLLLLLVGITIGFMEKRQQGRVCNQIVIEIDNQYGNYFIDENEVRSLITASGNDYIIGQDFANIPLNIYYTATPAAGTPPIGGYVLTRSLYRPAPATTPTGSTAVAWRRSVTEARIADIASGYTDEKQLLPIPAEARNTNNQLTQNRGY